MGDLEGWDSLTEDAKDAARSSTVSQCGECGGQLGNDLRCKDCGTQHGDLICGQCAAVGRDSHHEECPF